MVKKIHKKDNKEEEIGLDFGIGKLGLGGIFKGLEKFIDLAERAERAGGELKRSGMIKGLGGRKDIRGIYGFTIRTGLDKKSPKFETFGNIKETKKGPRVIETREPIVDVFDEKDHVVVVVELPGVAKEDVTIDIKGDILTIEGSHDARKYSKEILLPAPVDPKTLQFNFKNGIAELKLSKTKKKK